MYNEIIYILFVILSNQLLILLENMFFKLLSMID